MRSLYGVLSRKKRKIIALASVRALMMCVSQSMACVCNACEEGDEEDDAGAAVRAE